jgi:hypothetical protein
VRFSAPFHTVPEVYSAACKMGIGTLFRGEKRHVVSLTTRLILECMFEGRVEMELYSSLCFRIML